MAASGAAVPASRAAVSEVAVMGEATTGEVATGEVVGGYNGCWNYRWGRWGPHCRSGV